jgi:subfamily B ATP-binding cassette protein MsbA
MKDLWWLLRYVRPYVGRIVAATVCAAFISLCYLGLFSLVQPILDEIRPDGATEAIATSGKIHLLDQARAWVADASERSPAVAWLNARIQAGATGTGILVACVLIVVFLLKGVFTYLSMYLTRTAGLFAIRDLRIDLYTSIQRQSLAFFSTYPTGQLITRVMTDVARLQRTISGDLAEVIRLGAIITGQAIWLFYLNYKLAAFSLILLPMIVYPVARFGRRLKLMSHRSMEKMGESADIMKEGISAARIVRAFGMERFEVERFRTAILRMLRPEKKTVRILSLMPPLMELIAALGAGVLFAYASYRIGARKLSMGEFGTFLAALFMIYSSIKNLVRINNELQQSRAAAGRAAEIVDRAPDVAERPGAEEMPPFRECIEFRGVRFSYGDVAVLHDIDLKVRAGEMIALVGSSGAGKSTLVNLLPRFYDVTSGSLTLDGRDVRSVTLASLRRQIALVTQEVLLFDDSVRNNIAYGRGDIEQTRVEAAARAAHAHEFIHSLPKGYATTLGEAGQRLSQGQRQRLSIARALLKDSPVLILDEATSSLDSESEAEVQQALQNLMEGRTTFVIAHRLSTVRRADRIVVLDAGRVVECGTHAELLVKKGTYARFHALQFRDDDPAPRASLL